MSRVLATSSPTIVVECNPDGPFSAVEAIVTRVGCRFFRLCEGGPVTVQRIILDESERYRYHLCTTHDDWSVLN